MAESKVAEYTEALDNAKRKLETQKIRSTSLLPEFIRPFIDTLSIEHPACFTHVKRRNGAYGCTMKFDGIRTVYRIENMTDQSYKLLTVDAECWRSSDNWGRTESHQVGVTLWYHTPEDLKLHYGAAAAKKYEGANHGYEVAYQHWSRGIKNALRDIIKDMGYLEDADESQLVEFFYLLVGDLRKDVMRVALRPDHKPNLYTIIRDDLFEDGSYPKKG